MADETSSNRLPHRPDDGIPGAGRRREDGRARSKALVVTAWVTAGLVLLGGAGFGYVWLKLDGNLKGVDINAALGHDRPRNVDNGSMDILVLGSDSRAGDNAKYGGGDTGARADTAMVLHVYKGHQKASLVSIPRDTMVSRPPCAKRNDGGTAPAAERAMFNESYKVGGPACAVKTVESLSGIRMDHYLEVDFTGFKKLIDELGGVEINTKVPIKDKNSHLELRPGSHTLRGEQALGLVRTRHAVGDGSDLGRIQLQQAFVRALVTQVKNIGLFNHPEALYSLADTATQTVTTDSDLASVKDLMGFVKGLKGIHTQDMNMVTLPVVYDPDDPNRVMPLKKRTQQVWDALREDRQIPKSATKGSAGDKAGSSDVVTSS